MFMNTTAERNHRKHTREVTANTVKVLLGRNMPSLPSNPYTQPGTLHTPWYPMHPTHTLVSTQLVLYLQPRPSTTHNPVPYTQPGTLHTAWYPTHSPVPYTQSGILQQIDLHTLHQTAECTLFVLPLCSVATRFVTCSEQSTETAVRCTCKDG